MISSKITARTPNGIEYTATVGTPTRSDTTERMRFEVEVPARETTFVATYDEKSGALMSVGKVEGFGRRVGVVLTDEVREWVEAHERDVREAEARREQELGRIVAGITRDDSGSYVSADGLYSITPGMEGYVSLDCELTGLSDTTRGRVGGHPIYLQYPDEAVSEELLAGARMFSRAVDVYRREEIARREAERTRREAEAEARERAEAMHRARATGARAEIRSYATDCDDPREECSTDIVTVYALPDGRIEKRRVHAW